MCVLVRKGEKSWREMSTVAQVGGQTKPISPRGRLCEDISERAGVSLAAWIQWAELTVEMGALCTELGRPVA